jgi:hypothetical protein
MHMSPQRMIIAVTFFSQIQLLPRHRMPRGGEARDQFAAELDELVTEGSLRKSTGPKLTRDPLGLGDVEQDGSVTRGQGERGRAWQARSG